MPLVPEVNPEALAVMVRVPAVLKVKLVKVRVPETRVRLPAVVPPLSSVMVALLSELVIVTFGELALETVVPFEFLITPSSAVLTIADRTCAADHVGC